MKRACAGGRKVSETAKLRQYKYGGQNVELSSVGDMDKKETVLQALLPPYLIVP
jgi:hypothetical protein